MTAKQRFVLGFILILLAIFIIINLDIILPRVFGPAPIEKIETGLAYDRERNGISQEDIEYQWARALELEREVDHQAEIKKLIESGLGVGHE